MEILRTTGAAAALTALLDETDGIVALEIDPRARRGAALQLIAAGNADRGLVIDVGVGDAPALPLGDGPIAAWDAKAVHRALLRRGMTAPSRWACIRLTETLIAGGRPWSIQPDGVAERMGSAAPPDADDGLEALAARARWAAQAITQQIGELRRDELGRVSKIEASAVAPIAEMELRGMAFDAARWRSLTTESERERATLRGELEQLFAQAGDPTLFGGTSLNLDSDADLKAGLHALGFEVPNVRRATLASLAEPVGPVLRRYRELTKLVSSYGESFLEHVGADGRIHPTFEQIGASTGRMACHSPNLQAIVKDSPHRECFTCGAGRRLVIADYATCELRILAEMSGDPVFADAFARGEDLHSRVASSLFRTRVTKTENAELRHRAKAVNFGLAYGMGAGGLARAIDADLDTARSLLARYFETFPRIRDFLEQSARDALARGYATTLAGRRLYLDPGHDRSERAQAERIAKNMPIQGSNADITKIALARVRTGLAELPDAWLVNTVHDELVIECDADDTEKVRDVVVAAMESAGRELMTKIPLVVDAEIAQTWTK